MGYSEIIKRSQFWVIGISYFAISYGAYAILDFIVTYGTIELRIPYSVASFFITVTAFTGIIGGILMMILSDFIGTKRPLAITYTLMALSVLLIIFGGSKVLILMIAIGLFGFLYGAIFPMIAACARDYF